MTIAATIAENDLEVDSARQRWSIQHRCENGWISVGSGLFGLKLTADNELEIVPEEAAVIRYIYESYVDGGIGSKKIADALNAAGVQSRRGYPWDAKHIIGLLRNEKYKGDVIMGKSVKHFGECHKNPNAEYAPRYYMEGTHEAIVDKDTWEAAQRILEERSRNHCRTRIAHSFTGMIECGCCGKNYLHKVNNSQCKWQTDIWACRTYLRDGKKACGNSRIKDAVLKEKFISAYNEFIERRPQGDSMVALQEVLEDLRQQEQELAELMMQRLLTKAAYEEERKSIKTQITDISEKISERRAKRVPETEYKPSSNSLSVGQVLKCPYNYEKTKLIVREMIDQHVLDLVDRGLVTDQIVLDIGYDIENLTDPKISAKYHGDVTTDRYGRKVPKHAHSTANLEKKTSSSHIITEATMNLFDRIINKDLLVRRITVATCKLVRESDVKNETVAEQISLFDDPVEKEKREQAERQALEQEKQMQKTIIGIKKRFGKNAILKGMNFQEGATARERNEQVGGHKV